MSSNILKKSVSIRAPRQKVWAVLLEDHYTRDWYTEFSQGAHVETDWNTGSKAVFKDLNNDGLIARVAQNIPHEIISLEYEGVLTKGSEDYTSEAAQQVKGGREIYRLSEQDGSTVLAIECDMPDEYFQSMSLAWDSALQKVRVLSETN
jgi:hypothetical protein